MVTCLAVVGGVIGTIVVIYVAYNVLRVWLAWRRVRIVLARAEALCRCAEFAKRMVDDAEAGIVPKPMCNVLNWPDALVKQTRESFVIGLPMLVGDEHFQVLPEIQEAMRELYCKRFAADDLPRPDQAFKAWMNAGAAAAESSEK